MKICVVALGRGADVSLHGARHSRSLATKLEQFVPGKIAVFGLGAVVVRDGGQ
ncbi:hypothetical protein [Achromobacter ruhlandii]|uniref:hypothetical protein n=1 Tax=Achromobacter ruhlandii TaxID=72557 RepID=UPI0015833E95|nr:hypothetical protein [Achromobacter ruhlandii]